MDYIKYINQLSLVSTRINELLSDGHFELSQEYLRYIHKYLFKDIYPSNGEYRTYDLTKNEMTLNEKSVIYASYNTIETYLKYDLVEERKVNYSKLSKEVQVKKIADFTARLWSTHAFSEGNTRVVAVFIQKYLHHLGYKTDNNIFKENSRFFRNALVKASYYNESLHIHLDQKPLIAFFTKVMIDPTIELDEDTVYVNELFEPLQLVNRPDINSPYIKSLLAKFVESRDIPEDIDINASGTMQYFLNWLEELKTGAKNYAAYLSSLNLELKNYYLCEVGTGQYDSILYNSNYRGIILSPYCKGFNYYNGNIIVNGNLEFINGTPLIVPSSKTRKAHYPVDLGIKTFLTENANSLNKVSSWLNLKDSSHSLIIGAYGCVDDADISKKIAILDYFHNKYPDEFTMSSTSINNTYCQVLASKKLVKKK